MTMEPFTLAAIGGSLLSEAVKFLHEQATELVRYWRDRRDAEPGTAVAVPAADPPADLLDGRLAPLTVDDAALDRVASQLRDLRRDLLDYVDGTEPVAADDEQLLRRTDALRSVLEAVYQQRITFRGENREAAGPLLHGRIDVEAVAGYAAAVRIGTLRAGAGEIHGELRADRIERGGEGVGLDIDTVEGA
jgi:hypothetical protein